MGRLRWGAAALCLCAFAYSHSPAAAETRALSLYNIHNEETATIVFKRNGRYDRAGLKKLNAFLRDWRQDEPTNMDPQLFDLLWEVYRQAGGSKPIHVVSGYRSSKTNGMLRRRSSGVAKNSLHMKGQATDFFIPDVDLAKLRAIGLKMQGGGVGFYPTSGAPFVHLDTGSVRHWPRMSRQQLVRIFPDGRTLHVPSDGKPLPGYNRALAEYKSRKAKGNVVVASFEEPEEKRRPFWQRQEKKPVGEPLVIAAVSTDEDDDLIEMPSPGLRTTAVASSAAEPAPVPRISPKRPASHTAIAALTEPTALPAPPHAEPVVTVAPERLASASRAVPDFDFDTSAPAVPAALAAAMAERDQSRRGVSLPIAPTSIVATVDVNRPLRADAITTAVLRDRAPPGPGDDLPSLLAYAPAFDDAFPEGQPARPRLTALGVPVPAANPLRVAAAPTPATRSIIPESPYAMEAPELTYTALDTQGLRLWIGTESTRQIGYALLTMPDFTQMPSLSDKPTVAYASGFGHAAYAGLRTDRFSGPLVEQPRMVDLGAGTLVAAR